MTHSAALPTHAALDAIDRAHLIHPVSPWRTHEARGPMVLESAQGVWLKDNNGHRLLDAFAGLWCVNVGYGQESVIQAAADQMRKLPYATGYFHFSSEPAIRLAEKLVQITPASLTRVYMTLGGSESVDAAVRFIVQYYNATGRPSKKHFISLERGYHGSSSTGAGLTALPAFHRGFDLPLPTQHYIPSPNPYRQAGAADPQALIAESVAALRAKVAELGAENVAAFFCEPIQGSGGVIVPPEGWLKAMREATRELDILLVVDEVITGFGRCGAWTGAQAFGVTPDILNFAKQVTNGAQPLGGVIATKEIYDTFMAAGGPEYMLEFPHGYTYSAHPVACAAGNAVLDILQKEDAPGRVKALAPYFQSAVHGLKGAKHVADIRNYGLAAGFTIAALPGEPARRPYEIAMKCWDKGFYVRYGGDTIQLAPPFISTEAEIDRLVSALGDALDETA